MFLCLAIAEKNFNNFTLFRTDCIIPKIENHKNIY